MPYRRELFGVREQTIKRLAALYGHAYFDNRYASGEEESRRADVLRARMYKQELERVASYVGHFDRGGAALDVGCGRGEFLSLLGSQWQKYGIEISEHAAAIARSRGVVTDFEARDNFFDLIVFRGTIQHVPDPITKISECFYWLKPGGSIVFLATPNTRGVVYRLFGRLPMLDERLNFLLPSDAMLRQILSNFGFRDIAFFYPYRGTPYARPLRDFFSFLLRLFRMRQGVGFPFWGSVLECYARKPFPADR